MTAKLLPFLQDLYCSHVTGYHGRDNTFNRGSVTDKVLKGHLEGRWRVGTFFDPGDGTVILGVLDFDNKENPDGEKPHAKRAAEALAGLELSAEIFTSKGKGYHVPVYFTEPVPAWAVRRVLKYAAEKAGRPETEVFPKQDKVDVYIPPAGSKESASVGSYINLPFHGGGLPHGRTALLDKGNGLDPYPDQAEAAEGIKKNSAENLMAALAMIGEETTLLSVEGETQHPAARPVGDSIKEQARNKTLASLAGSMRRRGMSLGAIEAALLAENAAKCTPRLPEAEVRKIAKSIARYEPAAPVAINDAAPPMVVQETPALDFPAEVMTGAAGAFAHLYSSYLEAPKQFFYMAYLTCLGSYLSGSLTIDSEIRAQPRLYTLLLADSADDRKSTAISKTGTFFKESIADFDICRGVGSAEGLQTRLEGVNKKLLLSFDEFMAFVGKCKIESSVLLPCVNTMFEDNYYESRTKKNTVLLNNAHLSILAASTIATYERTWSPAFTDIGFNNRLWLVTGKGGRRFSCPRTIPEESKRLARGKLSAVLSHAENYPVMPIAGTALELYDDWYMNRPKTIHGKRLETYAMRFMSLLAVNDLKDEVDVETMRKVIALCDHQHHVRQLHDPVDADNVAAKLEEKIRRTLRAKGRVGNRELKRALHVRQTGLWFYNTALKNLIDEKEIALDKGSKVYFLQPEECHK